MPTYKTLKDVPEHFRPTIQKLMECGSLVGEKDPDPTRPDDNIINVSYGYCRIMTTLDRGESNATSAVNPCYMH